MIVGEGEWKGLDIEAGRSCSVTRRASTSRLGPVGPCVLKVQQVPSPQFRLGPVLEDPGLQVVHALLARGPTKKL